MPVVSAAFLLAISRALARIHVEHNDLWRSPLLHLGNPLARQIDERGKVLGPAQPLRRCNSGSAMTSCSISPSKEAIDRCPLSKIGARPRILGSRDILLFSITVGVRRRELGGRLRLRQITSYYR